MTRGWELIDTTTWTSTIRLGLAYGPLAFSPDSRMIAIEHHFNSYRRLDVADRGGDRPRDGADRRSRCRPAAQIAFSPDGTQLIASLLDRPLVRIWDLRAVRRRLAELDLDWSPPPAWGPPTPTQAPDITPRPPPYRVDRGQLDEWLKSRSDRRREQAVADAERAPHSRAGPTRGPRVAGGVLQQSRLGADRRGQVQPRPGSGGAPGQPGRRAGAGHRALRQYPRCRALPRRQVHGGHPHARTVAGREQQPLGPIRPLRPGHLPRQTGRGRTSPRLLRASHGVGESQSRTLSQDEKRTEWLPNRGRGGLGGFSPGLTGRRFRREPPG